MERRQQPGQSDPITTAIERVLTIERQGAEQLRLSEQRAGEILSEARDQAAAIERRADARIARLHNRYLQNVQREVELLAEAGRGSVDSAGSFDQAALAQAARRLAAKLTGAA